jgi:hypothetical protein
MEEIPLTYIIQLSWIPGGRFPDGASLETCEEPGSWGCMATSCWVVIGLGQSERGIGVIVAEGAVAVHYGRECWPSFSLLPAFASSLLIC